MKLYLQNYLVLLLFAISGSTAFSHEHTKQPREKAFSAFSGSAFAPDGKLWNVRLNERSRLEVAISRDDGKTWFSPRLLNTGDDKIKAGNENPPKIVFGPNGIVLVVYTKSLEKKYTSEIRLLRSVDGGKNFVGPTTLHSNRQVVSHSFPVIAFDGAGILHTIWIDSREREAATKSNQSDIPNDSPTDIFRGVSLYHNISTDGGASFGPDQKLVDHSCECCRIALSFSHEGQIALLWRQVIPSNIRDHAFTTLGGAANSGGVETAIDIVRASFDNWAIDACPHHGPALTSASKAGYHAVWFGERDGIAGVRYGNLASNGTPIGRVLLLPDENAEHADILRSGEKLVIVWRSTGVYGTTLRAWISNDEGGHFTLKEIVNSKSESDNPKLLSKAGKIFVIWNTSEKLYVQEL